ncbi:hypothetical protein YB2330_006432 [Saitoella coloradoensis]
MKLATLSAFLAATATVFQTVSSISVNAIFDQHPLQLPLHDRKKPNIVFILTDDQDLHMSSLSYMPHLNSTLIQHGTLYNSHYVTTALCCPSRVSLWTGLLAHNTNVTDVNPPYGGYPKFVQRGFNDKWLPVWLNDAGYGTYYTGKLFNAHTVDNYDEPHVKGFTGSDFLLDPYTYQYRNATFQRNREKPMSHKGQYSTDVLAAKTYGFLDEAVERYEEESEPFFLAIAPVAPHSNVEFNSLDIINGPEFKTTAPLAADRHAHLFPDAIVPRTPNFNPDTPSGVNWIKKLEKQSENNVEYNDHFYRQRLRALQAVDEIVLNVTARLAEAGLLDDTYIIYTSDNGYHIGQHRLQPGKECGFEEDIAVPLIIRGPGVPKGEVVDGLVTTHVDLAPTLFSIAGIPLREEFDGTLIPLSHKRIKHQKKHGKKEHAGVEYWGFALEEGEYGFSHHEGEDVKGYYTNNTYKALRLVGKDYNLYYSVWCNNEHELYDLDKDPYQLTNLYTNSTLVKDYELLGYPLKKVLGRLDALLFVLKSCTAGTCQSPWSALHPFHHHHVSSLTEALDERFDEYYEEEVEKIRFDRCEQGYIVEAEGPQWDKSMGMRGGLRWSEWV